MDNSVEFLIKTTVPKENYKLKWVVENVLKIPSGEKTKSSYFRVNNEIGVEFHVFFVNYGSIIDLALVRSSNSEPFYISSDVQILDCNGKVFYESTAERFFDKQYQTPILYFERIIENTLNGLKSAPNDQWNFIFNIKYYPTIRVSTCKIPKQKIGQEEALNTFSANFWKMFQNKIGTDVTLQVKNDKIEAHKFVLSAQSPVFAKMFDTPMSENKTNSVAIDDVSLSAMTKLVHFMYSKIEMEYTHFDANLELYYAADKYEVFVLRELCSEILLSLLTEDNAGMLLEMADKHNDVGLKNKVMIFVNSNIKSCFKKDWMHELIGKQNDLRKELMNFIE